MTTQNDLNNVAQNQAPEDTKSIVTPEILNLDYRYVKLLGEGANGLTWLAKDRKTGLDIAIKELKFVDDFKAWELFKREAEVLQSIDVDGVPKCYAHISKDFTSYIIQEYIPYPSLESMLEKGEIFSEAEVFQIMSLVSKILYALQVQYIPAIIHRDIKPGNILYRRATSTTDAKVWLIDFGAVDNAHKQSSGSTIAGTFGYMAPEQLQGEVSPRSDFYSLGATALHLLTGVFPYEIPSELFQLKFHPVIEEHAPETTKPMYNFLDALLASDPKNRPEDIKVLRKMLFDASESANKYRQIQTVDEVLDLPPKTKLGKKFRNTKIGTKLHNLSLNIQRTRLKKKREYQIKRLEKLERKAKEKREKLEKLAQQELEKNGVQCTCTVKRVSLASIGANDDSMLEGLFSYQGYWYNAYILGNNISKYKLTIKNINDAPEGTKIEPNTFKVIYVPENIRQMMAEETGNNDLNNSLNRTNRAILGNSQMHISHIAVAKIVPEQTIWLTEDFYMKFAGKKSNSSKSKLDEIKKKIRG